MALDVDEYTDEERTAFATWRAHELGTSARDRAAFVAGMRRTESLFTKIAWWSAETFPASTFESTLNHFERELGEFWVNPHDRLERADLVFLLIQLARLDGDDLLEAIRAKFEINKARTWQPPDDDGVVEHVR